MEELLNQKTELESELESIQNKINELEAGTIDPDIDDLIDKIKTNETESSEIIGLLNKLDTVKNLDVNMPADKQDKIKLAKKIYSFSNDDVKKNIIEELANEEKTEVDNLFDKALKFFDLPFRGTVLKSYPDNDDDIFHNKTVVDINTELVTKQELTDGKNLKTDIIALDLDAEYGGTEISNIMGKKLNELNPPVELKKIKHKNNGGTINSTVDTDKFKNNKCIDMVNSFFKNIESIPNIINGNDRKNMRISGKNIKNIMDLITHLRDEFSKAIPKMIKISMDTQTGGAFNPSILKNSILISIYIDILTTYLAIINTRISDIDQRISILNHPSSNNPSSNNPTDTTNSRIEAATNAANIIKNYLAIFMESRLKALNQFDMMLIEYLQELELPNHIAISIFMIPKMSVIRDIIQSQAADKMFAIYEITRLKKESDYVRFEQNYGPVNPMMPFY